MSHTHTHTEPTAEQILAITRSNSTANEKERMLLTIGLQWYEASALARMSTASDNEPTTANIIANELPNVQTAQIAPAVDWFAELAGYTCGIEIECFAPREAIIQAARDRQIAVFSESYNHTDRAEGFKLVSDSSLEGHDNAVECVTNVLHFNESADVMNRFCDALGSINTAVNKTCGLHVHVACEGLTAQQYCNTFVNYMYLSDLIESCLPLSRRNSRWAARLIKRETAVLEATNPQEMYEALYQDRYWQVNPDAYFRHHTIEFRQHSATIEAVKINNWCAFCTKLVYWSKNHRLTAETAPKSFDDIEFLTDSEKAYFNARVEKFAYLAQQQRVA